MISGRGFLRFGLTCGGLLRCFPHAHPDWRGPDEFFSGRFLCTRKSTRRGEYELETSRRSSDSLRYFKEIERLYPYTEWSRRALIMQAFAHQSRARI